MVNRNIRWLSFGFALLFFGFDGVQQFITSYFSDLGRVHIGFNSLILIYLAFTILNPISALLIGRWGAKRSMMAAVIIYSGYTFSLIGGYTVVIYPFSILLGLAAAALWASQNSYLIRASEPDRYGKNSGWFSTMFSVGAGLGVLMFGLLSPAIGFDAGLILFGVTMLATTLVLGQLDDIRNQGTVNKWQQMRRALRSLTIWRFGSLWFIFNFIQGLMLGIIPLIIIDTINLRAVGFLVALFYLAPMAFAYAVGRRSDQTGRRFWIIVSYFLSIAGVGLMFGADQAPVLVAAVVLFALNFGISRTVTFALIGDISTDANTESVSSMMWLIQSFATLTALIGAKFLPLQPLYGLTLGCIVLSFVWLAPLLRRPLHHLQEQISSETGQ